VQAAHSLPEAYLYVLSGMQDEAAEQIDAGLMKALAG
jgi:hypothetical protein